MSLEFSQKTFKLFKTLRRYSIHGKLERSACYRQYLRGLLSKKLLEKYFFILFRRHREDLPHQKYLYLEGPKKVFYLLRGLKKIIFQSNPRVFLRAEQVRYL